MSNESLDKAGLIYFLLNISGLTIFDIKFSSYAPRTDSIILGGLVNAISTFSDSMMDNISSESGTLNVIEREGKKIMFERGQEIEAILVVDNESQILMEKIRAIIDIFEFNYLKEIKEQNIQTQRYIPFRELTRKFMLSHLDENLIFKQIKDEAYKNRGIEIPSKYKPLLELFDGKLAIIEISRKINWPLEYCIARTAILKEIGYLKSVDIAIKNTDIFKIEKAHIGIILEQGMAYQTIFKHWGEWGIKITQKIDGRHSIKSLSANLTTQEKMRMIQLFRYLSISGYISLLSDSGLLLIVFEEFLKLFRLQLVKMFGENFTFTIFETIFNHELERAKNKGRIITIAKLVENYMKGLYFEKLEAVLNTRPQIMTPLFQNAFLPFLDSLLHNLSKIVGKKAAMDLLQITIIETENYYGTLIYDILFLS
ncbi:MAG: hypothetical protein ACFFB2_04750 [Promethearchaeota archaeon]